MNRRKHGFHAIKTAALSLVLAASFQVAAQNDKERVETIEVFGQKTTPQLKKAFDNQRFEFLELYNSINDVAKFDVIVNTRSLLVVKLPVKAANPAM